MVTRFRVVVALGTLALAGIVAAGVGAAIIGKGTGAPLQLRKTALGRVLVDGRGRTLYLFEADKGKTSVCYGQCATFWPPLVIKGKPAAGAGLKASLLGVTMRKGGAHQLTYAGHPLYRFFKDAKPGQATGQGVDAFGGEWYVLSAAGRKIERSASPAPAPTTGTTPTTETAPGSGY